VSKVERAEAIVPEVMDEIILASDAVMVARGDLGVEIGDANLPAVQKLLIKRTRELNRIAITATQMMESMIDNPIPTRAEVFDVANAVYDGTDAIMLSAELHRVNIRLKQSKLCTVSVLKQKNKQSCVNLITVSAFSLNGMMKPLRCLRCTWLIILKSKVLLH